MKNVKLLNGLLWVLNGLLGAGILAFAWFFLLFPKDANSLKSYRWDDDPEPARATGQNPGDDRVLKSLPNPLEKPLESGPVVAASTFRATLKGTICGEKDPKNAVAFLKSLAKNAELVAYVGEDIREGDKIFEEFRGWKLVEVGKTWASFSNGPKKETLTLDLSSPPSPAGAAPAGVGARHAKIGQSYQANNFKSQLLTSTDNRVIYGLDPDEIEWAIQNQDSIMNESFTVSPAAGGIRIDTIQAGSIGAARGFVAGDVIKDVNGQPLSSVADVRSLMSSPAMRTQTGMRITVERAGKPVVIEYRPLPGK